MSERIKRQPVSFCKVGDAHSGQRIDNFLLARFRHVPKGHVYKWIRTGEVRVNKGRVKPVYRLQMGDEVRIPPVDLPVDRDIAMPGDRHQSRLRSAIVYEDSRMIVLDKPAGMAVHGGSGLDFGVIEVMRALKREARFLELAHRLDKDTSGCLLLAKKRSALRLLHEAFRSGQMEKKYIALVAGHLPRHRVTVSVPLKRAEMSGERVVVVDDEGKRAISHFSVLQKYDDSTLVEVFIETGRTHQIRVHAAYLGCPIVGDVKYGSGVMNRRAKDAGLGRLFLHASSVLLPEGLIEGASQSQFDVPLSAELVSILSDWY